MACTLHAPAGRADGVHCRACLASVGTLSRSADCMNISHPCRCSTRSAGCINTPHPCRCSSHSAGCMNTPHPCRCSLRRRGALKHLSMLFTQKRRTRAHKHLSMCHACNLRIPIQFTHPLSNLPVRYPGLRKERRDSPFLHLPLQIRGKDSVEACLKDYTNGELMDGENKVTWELEDGTEVIFVLIFMFGYSAEACVLHCQMFTT